MSAAGIGYASQKKCRQLMHNLYTYAIKYEIVPATADASRFVDIDRKVAKYPKKPFNTRQLNRVKKLAENDEPLSCWAQAVVMMIYGGPRTSEFLSVLKTDVKLKQRYFIVRDSKTEAGRNRNVMDATSCHHTPHECRHTYATMLDNAGANETAVKRILGHASQGVTKGVYMHKSLHELKKLLI